MIREIGAVLVAYICMAVFIFATLSVAYMALGSEGAFLPGSYDVSMSWILITTLLGLIAAGLGGLVCAIIALKAVTPKALAGAVLVLGLLMAIPVLTADDSEKKTVRAGAVAMSEAMTDAQQPIWVAFLNPLVGAVGVLGGARLKRKK